MCVFRGEPQRLFDVDIDDDDDNGADDDNNDDVEKVVLCCILFEFMHVSL